MVETQALEPAVVVLGGSSGPAASVSGPVVQTVGGTARVMHAHVLVER
jgi:hypothetical protein